ncbi:MAG: SGNH/GDSL hydrolase family protein [Deltaproteobacteria bacterium]|nr:SGNH/GDSL hydrolase family protein [Deltaproteobacteria bacterium]
MRQSVLRLVRVPAIIVGLYLAGEVAVRWHRFGPGAIRHPMRYRATDFLNGPMWAPHPDPAVRITLRPNARLRFKGRSFTTNEYGLRGPAVKLEKTPGVTRIALIGACFAAGEEVDDGEEYPRLLEGLLNTTGPGRSEVLNFSSPGRTPAMLVRLYDHDVRRFQPDLILVEYGGRAHEFSTVGEVPLYQWRPPPRTTVQAILGSTFVYATLREQVAAWGTRHLFPVWQERLLAGVAGGAATTRGPLDLVAKPPPPLPPWLPQNAASGGPAGASSPQGAAGPAGGDTQRVSALDQFLEQRRRERIPVVLVRVAEVKPGEQPRVSGDGVYVIDLSGRSDFGVWGWHNHRSFAERLHAELRKLLAGGLLPANAAPSSAPASQPLGPAARPGPVTR